MKNATLWKSWITTARRSIRHLQLIVAAEGKAPRKPKHDNPWPPTGSRKIETRNQEALCFGCLKEHRFSGAYHGKALDVKAAETVNSPFHVSNSAPYSIFRPRIQTLNPTP